MRRIYSGTCFIGSLLGIISILASFSVAAEWHDFYFDAQYQSKQKNWEKAIELYKKAIEVEPEPSTGKRFGMGKKRYSPYLELGLAYLGLGDIEAAHQACTKSKEKGIAPSKTIDRCLEITSKFLGELQATTSPSPTSQTEAPPSIIFTTAIPAEIIQKNLDIDGVVKGSNGIKELKATVKNLGISAITTFGMRRQNEEEFWITIPLDFGKNEITLEAIDTKGQIGKKVFTVVRQTSTAQTKETIPTPLPTATPTLKALQGITPIPEPTSVPTPTHVEQLLQLADKYFDRQWFLTPQETNAFDTYKDVLQLAPENRHAQERIYLMLQTYQRWGDNHFTDQNYEKAQTYYHRYLKIATYLLEELDEQQRLPDIQTTQERLAFMQAPPTPVEERLITAAPTPTPLKKPSPTPTLLPLSIQDYRPSITLTSQIPKETEREDLRIEGFATDDIGVSTVNVRVEKPGTRGLVLAAERQNQQEELKTFNFHKTVQLFPGQNIIHIEAIDTIGQMSQHELQVHRKMMSLPKDRAAKDVAGSAFAGSALPTRDDIYAVIIGIGQYQDERLNLRFTVNDAQGLYNILTDPNYGGVPKDHIKLLLNEEATDRNIKGAIGRWLSRQAKEDDTVLIYYSGHGAPEGRETYWVTYNADIDDLYTTALNNDNITNMLDRLRSRRVIMFLDSCYSAATVNRKNRTRSIPTEIPWEKFAGEGHVTISASDGKELSLELEEYRHGVFTYYLLEGLKGKADYNTDGIIEVDEIWDYVKYQVSERARKAGNLQTPVFQGAITAGIPLTYNKEHFEKKQQEKAIKGRQKKLADLYEQGVIETDVFVCALRILNEGTANRWLDDLLTDKITPQLFNQFFTCE